MSTKPWENLLATYFLVIKESEDQCDALRDKLVQDEHFNPGALFKALDNGNKNFLSLNDFKSFLINHPIEYEEECLRRMIHHYDKDEDFAINFDEFCKFILPSNYQPQTLDNSQTSVDSSLEDFVELIKTELNMNKSLANIIKELKASKDFTTYEAFISIVKNDKYITKDNLKNFLELSNIDTSQIDLKKILYRLDCDIDGKISYNEFILIFFPYRNDFNYKQNNPKPPKEPLNKPNKHSVFDNDSKNIGNMYSKFVYDYGNSKYIPSNLSNRNRETHKEVILTYTNDIPNNQKVSHKAYSNSIGFPGETTNNNISYKQQLYPSNMIYSSNEEPSENEDYQDKYLKYRSKLNMACSSLMDSNLQGNEEPQSFNEPLEKDKVYPNFRTTMKKEVEQISDSQIPKKTCTNSCCCSCKNCPCICMEGLKRSHLFNFFDDILEKDKQVEAIKESLALCCECNIQNLFEFFDYNQNGNIEPKDLIDSCEELGLLLTVNDVKIIFKRFSKDLTVGIDIREFRDIILPKKYSIAKILNDRYPEMIFNGFTREVICLLGNLIRGIINGEKSIERYRRILKSLPSVSPLELFDLLKNKHSNGILKQNISDFFKENGKMINILDLDLLMSRLDKDQDGIISYNEFLAEMYPKLFF